MSFYIFPTFFFSNYIDVFREMQGGYGHGPFLIESLEWGFTKIIYHISNIIYHIWVSLTVPLLNQNLFSPTDNWETNLYTSLLGFILITICMGIFFINIVSKKIKLNKKILISFCIISVLSVK